MITHKIFCKSGPSLRYSQPTSFTVSHLTPPDRTALPAGSLDLLCWSSNSLELATRQSPWPSAQQQQPQTIAENEPISSLPLSTHSAVEMFHDSVLYKSIIDIDICWIYYKLAYISFVFLLKKAPWHTWQSLHLLLVKLILALLPYIVKKIFK